MVYCLLASHLLKRTTLVRQTFMHKGLGASKGRELGKYADGYTGYVHMAQDAVSVLFHFPHMINGRSGVLVLKYIPYR
jgi:hypothetical protein